MTHKDAFRKTGPQTNNSTKQTQASKEYEHMLQIFAKPRYAKVSEEQRNKLILEANKLLNAGDIEKARFIYASLNYYSGLVRIGNIYHKEGKILEAFACFHHAGAKRETQKLSQDIAGAIQNIL